MAPASSGRQSGDRAAAWAKHPHSDSTPRTGSARPFCSRRPDIHPQTADTLRCASYSVPVWPRTWPTPCSSRIAPSASTALLMPSCWFALRAGIAVASVLGVNSRPGPHACLSGRRRKIVPARPRFVNDPALVPKLRRRCKERRQRHGQFRQESDEFRVCRLQASGIPR